MKILISFTNFLSLPFLYRNLHGWLCCTLQSKLDIDGDGGSILKIGLGKLNESFVKELANSLCFFCRCSHRNFPLAFVYDVCVYACKLHFPHRRRCWSLELHLCSRFLLAQPLSGLSLPYCLLFHVWVYQLHFNSWTDILPLSSSTVWESISRGVKARGPFPTACRHDSGKSLCGLRHQSQCASWFPHRHTQGDTACEASSESGTSSKLPTELTIWQWSSKLSNLVCCKFLYLLYMCWLYPFSKRSPLLISTRRNTGPNIGIGEKFSDAK